MTDKLPEPPITPRVPGEGVHPLSAVLEGLEEREVFDAIRDGIDAQTLLDEAHVLCFAGEGYPRVDDHTGHILCPDEYTRTHDPVIVYLDIVHELVHVRQVMNEEQVYHFPEPYVEWPTEIEAYRITYEEARRLGLSDEWFLRYLAVPWIETEAIRELAEAIGMPETSLPPLETDSDEEGARH